MNPILDVDSECTLLVNEAAKLMGVSRRTVYYRISAGMLRKVRTLGGSTRVVVPSVALLVQLGQRKNAARPRTRRRFRLETEP